MYQTTILVNIYVVSWLMAVNGFGLMDSLSAQQGGSEEDTFQPSNQDTDTIPAESLYFLENVPRGVRRVKVGESLVLDCEASGRPTPTIHWLFNGNRIAQGEGQNVLEDEAVYEASASSLTSSLRVGSTKSRLFIDCFGISEAGKYTCVAETPEGRISSTTTLKIEKSRPFTVTKSSMCKAKRNSQDQSAAARIFMWTSQRLEFEGRDVQLFCRAEGHPTPRITWVKDNGKPIDMSQSRYMILPTGDLVIKNIGWSDMGLYTCTAENDLGKDETGVFLYPTTP